MIDERRFMMAGECSTDIQSSSPTPSAVNFDLPWVDNAVTDKPNWMVINGDFQCFHHVVHIRHVTQVAERGELV